MQGLRVKALWGPNQTKFNRFSVTSDMAWAPLTKFGNPGVERKWINLTTLAHDAILLGRPRFRARIIMKLLQLGEHNLWVRSLEKNGTLSGPPFELALKYGHADAIKVLLAHPSTAH